MLDSFDRWFVRDWLGVAFIFLGVALSLPSILVDHAYPIGGFIVLGPLILCRLATFDRIITMLPLVSVVLIIGILVVASQRPAMINQVLPFAALAMGFSHRWNWVNVKKRQDPEK